MDNRTKEDVFNGVPPPPIKDPWWFKISVVACLLLALYGIIMVGRHYDLNLGYVPREQPAPLVLRPEKTYDFTVLKRKWIKKYGNRKMPAPPETKAPIIDPNKTPHQLYEQEGP